MQVKLRGWSAHVTGRAHDPPLSGPVELLMRRAGEMARERGGGEATVADLLAAFAARHGPMLERLADRPLGERPTWHGEGEAPAVADLLAEAAGLAREKDEKLTDLRHVGRVLLERGHLEAGGESVSSPSGRGSGGGAAAERRRAAGSGGEGVLDRVGRDLTALARAGELPRVVGRESVLAEVVEVLCRRLKRNPLLVGPPGAGKTAVAEGLAGLIARGEVPAVLRDTRLVELSAGALVAVSPTLPEFVATMEAVLAEAAEPGVVLFFDEFQSTLEVGGPDLGVGARLKPAMARGEIACMGAISEADYQRTVAADPALDRRFEPVRVEPLDPAATLEVLRAVAPTLTDAPLGDDLLAAVVDLSERYLRNRQLPDKAVDVLDRVVARARREGTAPSEETAADVISAMTGLPLGAGAREIADRVAGLRDYLGSRIVGQDEAIATLTEHLALKVRNLDLRPERPNGVFLFAGPTGVGKTEVARATAEYLFGSEDRLVRLDMSEFREEHYASRLLGAPPGYVGYDEGSPFLEEIASRPFAVVLLDEVEKAHPAVHRYFLQVFDDGFLTSGSGRRVYFSDAIIIMTSNIDIRRTQRHAGFTADAETVAELDSLREYFPPEFINRVDAVCAFNALRREDVERIVRDITLTKWQGRRENSNLTLELTESALRQLAEEGYNEQLGVRELQRVVERELLSQIPALVPPGKGGRLRADCVDGEIVVRTIRQTKEA